MPECKTCGRHVPRAHEEQHEAEHMAEWCGQQPAALRFDVTLAPDLPSVGTGIPNEGSEGAEEIADTEGE